MVKTVVGGCPKILDLKTGKIYNYAIKKWGKDSNSRFITMKLASNNCAVFDINARKLRILPNEVTETFVSTYCEKNYILVKLFGGEFSFYHLSKYFVLNVRYDLDQIKQLGYKMNWIDIVKRSPEDFAHLPNEFVYDKKVVAKCYKTIAKILEEKKQTLSKEEYKEYRSKITKIYNNRIISAYPSVKESVNNE